MQILGHEYEIRRASSEKIGKGTGQLKSGSVDMARHMVVVSDSIDEQEAVSTLIHEMVEIWDFRLNLNLEHHQICLIETAIFESLGELNYQGLARSLTQEREPNMIPEGFNELMKASEKERKGWS